MSLIHRSSLRLIALVCLLIWQLTVVVAQPKPNATNGQLKRQLQQAQYDTTRLRLCVSIGKYYFSRSQFDSLHPYIQKGMSLLTRAPSEPYSSDLHYLLAKYYRHIGLYQQGIQSIKVAIEQAQRAHSPYRITECQYALAVLYSDAGQLSKAADQITHNLQLLRHIDNKPVLAANYLLIIFLFQELKNESMQTLYTNRYIALAKQCLSVEDQMFAYALKADLLTKKGDYREAKRFYQQATDQAYLTHNAVYVIEMLNTQSINFRHLGQYQTAVNLLNKAFTMAKSLTITGSMALIKRELAMTYLASRQPEKALHEATYALQLSRQNKTPTSIMRSLEYLGKVLETTGHYQEALKLYKEQSQLKEQEYTETSVKSIAQMQTQFETETKEQTIKILQKNAQIDKLKVWRQQQELTISRRNQLTNASIICLLLILMGVVFYFWQQSRQSYRLLEQTTHDLTEANNVKDKLFSIISHDLRSPLASIKTTLHQTRQLNKPASVTLINQLDRQVDTVLDLLTNLLDWSVNQFKGIKLTQEPLLLQSLIEDTVGQASDLIDQKQLGLLNQLIKTHVVIANRHQLRAVIRNLLNNAIKFTPVGGYIRLQSVKKDDFIELTIRDTGIGMSSEQLATLLIKPEVRTGTAGEAGTGLGLRISKELVDRLGGTLQVESWPHKGTLVRIRLKACPDQTLPQSVCSIKETNLHTL